MEGGIFYNETKFVDAKVKKLGSLIQNMVLHIPPHQRDYSWEQEDVNQFLSDVKDIIKLDFSNPAALPHFIGSFVFIRDNDKNSYEIIDGQQRATTTMLYFFVIKLLASKFLKDNYDYLYSIRSRVERYIYKSEAGQPVALRLTLGRAYRFFEKVLLAPSLEEVNKIYDGYNNKKDVEKRIYFTIKNIFSTLENEIKDVSTQDCYNILLKYIEAVFTMMVAIEIIVQEAGVAYTIFETLNKRGKELSAANLIKNSLLQKAEKEGSDKRVLTIWSEMVEEITQHESSDITDFIANSYYSRYGEYINSTLLFDKIKNKLNSIKALSYAEGLEKDYKPYTKIKGFNSTEDEYFSKETLEYLYHLKKSLNIVRADPLLLAGHEILAPTDFQELVKATVNFAFRYKTVMGKSADTLVKLSTHLALSLRDDNLTVKDIKNSFLENANDNAFKISFETFCPGTNKIGFYIIKKIEDHLSNGQGIKVSDQSPLQHLEHIMPQNINETEWGHLYEGGKKHEKFSSYLDRVGNLTILERNINCHIKNKSFNHKILNEEQKGYSNSALKLPKKIQNFSNNGLWDFSSIDKRSKYLAELAIKVWSLD